MTASKDRNIKTWCLNFDLEYIQQNLTRKYVNNCENLCLEVFHCNKLASGGGQEDNSVNIWNYSTDNVSDNCQSNCDVLCIMQADEGIAFGFENGYVKIYDMDNRENNQENQVRAFHIFLNP